MSRTQLRRRRRGESGVIAVVAALLAVPMMGFVAVGLQTGISARQAEVAQSTVDAASLAAAESLAGAGTLVQANAAALTVTELNGYPDTDLGGSPIFYDTTGAIVAYPGGSAAAVASVKVTITHRSGTTFGAVLGVTTSTVSTSATAAVPPPAGGVGPPGGANDAGTAQPGEGSPCCTTASGDNGRAVGDRMLMPSPGEIISSMRVCFVTPAAASLFEVSIYTDVETSPGHAHPGTLVGASTSTAVLTAGTACGSGGIWSTTAFASSVTLQPDTFYWFLAESNTGTSTKNEVEYYYNTNADVMPYTLGDRVTVAGLPGGYPSWPANPAVSLDASGNATDGCCGNPTTKPSFAYYIEAVSPAIGAYAGNTLGYNIPLWHPDSGEGGSVEGNHVYTGNSVFVIGSLSAYYSHAGCPAGSQFQMAIYSDVANVPSAVLIKSSITTIVNNAWNTVTLTPAYTLSANSSYWILIDNSDATSQCDVAIGPQANERGGYSGTASVPCCPATFPTNPGSWTISSDVYSFYASAGIAAGGSPILTG